MVCKQEIDRAYTREEASSRQYYASFARMKRLAYQNMYEDAVRAEIQRASTLVGDSPTSNLADVLNMNAPAIQSNFSAFSNMQPFLDSFDTLDTAFIQQDSNYAALDAANRVLSNYENDAQSAYLSTVRFPGVAAIQTLYESAKASFNTQSGNVQTIVNRINTVSTTLGGQIAAMNTSIRSFFAPTEQYENANTISTMLRAGFDSGYNNALFNQ